MKLIINYTLGNSKKKINVDDQAVIIEKVRTSEVTTNYIIIMYTLFSPLIIKQVGGIQ